MKTQKQLSNNLDTRIGTLSFTWFGYFRLYVPTEAHFDGKWVLPDFEQVK